MRVAVLATTDDRRRALIARVEAAGHIVVESDAQLILADADVDGALDATLTAAAELVAAEPDPEPAAGFRAASEAPVAILTPREVEILTALGEGLSNKEVGRALGISAHTVKFHLETIFRKLDATSRAEAVAKGLRRGIIEL